MSRLTWMDGICVFLAILFVVSAARMCTACGGTLTPDERAHLAQHAATLERCQEEGRKLGPDGGMDAYELCKRDAGITK